MQYRQGRRSRRLTLGHYPRLALTDARAMAKEALARVELGESPTDERRAARTAPTFGDLVAAYLERHAKKRKRSWREDARMLKKYIPNGWQGRAAAEITRREVRDLLATLATHAPVQANRLLACLRKMFNVGIQWDIVGSNPCAVIERPGAERQGDRVLTASELRAVCVALDAEDEHTAALFRLALLTAARGGEVKTMRWEDIDGEACVWTVPAHLSKNGRAHRVPLSPAAMTALSVLRATRLAVSPWVFASASASGFRETVQKAMRRIRKASGVQFVPHDLRRTVASNLAAMGYDRVLIGKILNHASADSSVTAIYERHGYDREKRAALDAWARRLAQIVADEAERPKVVAIR